MHFEDFLDYLESQGMIIKDKNYMHESSEKVATETIPDIQNEKIVSNAQISNLNSVTEDNMNVSQNNVDANNFSVFIAISLFIFSCLAICSSSKIFNPSVFSDKC